MITQYAEYKNKNIIYLNFQANNLLKNKLYPNKNCLKQLIFALKNQTIIKNIQKIISILQSVQSNL